MWKSAFFCGQRARFRFRVEPPVCFLVIIIRVKKPRRRREKKRSFPRANVTTCFSVFRSRSQRFPFPRTFHGRVSITRMTSCPPGNFDLRPNQPQLVGTYRPIYLHVAYDTVTVRGRVTRCCGRKTTGGTKKHFRSRAASINVRISRALVVISRVFFTIRAIPYEMSANSFLSHYTHFEYDRRHANSCGYRALE